MTDQTELKRWNERYATEEFHFGIVCEASAAKKTLRLECDAEISEGCWHRGMSS